MGLSLAFHIVFAALGVGLPLLLVVADLAYRRTKERDYDLLARRMAKGTAVLFAVGAVSGTVLSLELGLLWPELMRRFGEVIGPMFALEGFAFFTEAIFLGIYLYGRDRVAKNLHLLSGVVVAVSGALSAAFVTVVNAFMNEPIAVRWDDGRAYLNAPMDILGSPSAPTQILHVLLSSYATTLFAMCGVHAWLLLRGKERAFNERALKLALPMACVVALLMPLSGDLSAGHVARNQTWKLGAMEAHYKTEACAALHLGGIPDDEKEEVRLALHLPCGLSLLSFHDPHAEVKGLDRVPYDERPPVARTHYAFQVMVGSGSLVALIAVVSLAFRLRKKRFPEARRYLWLLVAIAPLPAVAMEAGWLVTEWGRQPYVVRGLLTTHAAATQATHLAPRLFVFGAIYLFLALTVGVVMRRLFLGEGQNHQVDIDSKAKKSS